MVTTKRHGETTRHGDPDEQAHAIASLCDTSHEFTMYVLENINAEWYETGKGYSVYLCWSLLKALGYA